jgi:trehalose synthase
MKDMSGVMTGFVEHVDHSLGAHLLLCGPAVTGVADDPEAAEVLEECMGLWRTLPHAARSRVHLACTPMADPDEAAAIVNALQRHATILLQKSLREGFGLTVTEAMWKARPVIASAVGGIQDQIEDGVQGILLADPTDLDAFAAAIARLLADPAEAERMGARGHARVLERYLGLDSLLRYGALIELLDADTPARDRLKIATWLPQPARQ